MREHPSKSHAWCKFIKTPEHALRDAPRALRALLRVSESDISVRIALHRASLQAAHLSLGSTLALFHSTNAPEYAEMAHHPVWYGSFWHVPSPFMDGITINITWEYFLGITGSLIALAYYANGRFSVLETDIGWLKEMISELAIRAENVTAKLFKNGSPVSLTSTGYHALHRSGLRSYVDANRRTLLAAINVTKSPDPYEVEQRAFGLLAELTLDAVVDRRLNKFAFKSGMSTTILRRAAAIYLRELAVQTTE